MLFNSAAFLCLFLPLTCIGYQVAARFGRRSIIGWLAFCSLVFYSWWNWHFLFVLLGSMLVNFAASRLIAAAPDDRRKKFWMIAGIVTDLAILVYFKYLFHVLMFLHQVGVGHHAWSEVLLPLGISFFTFTQIAYLVDLSQGQAEPQNFVEFALFVSFFPHLIAGPILHHKEMMPQFLADRDPHLRMDDMLVGISWFVLGLAKKCLLADQFSGIVKVAFDPARPLGLAGSWCGVVMYSLQLYFDFSGYSDMAIGLARMFSIEFPLNFNSPYKATNVIDFWQRWHMTLTRYLTLYLYNPMSLSVNRRRMRAGKKVSTKAARTLPGFLSMIAWPTLATMVIVGVWHGAGMQFMVFGLLHGVYLTVNHGWRLYRGEAALRRPSTTASHVSRVLLTYVCVLVGQVFFRADSLGAALRFVGGMAGLHGVGNLHALGVEPQQLLLAVVGLFIVWSLPNTQEILGQEGFSIKSALWSRLAWRPTWQWSVAMGMLFLVALLNLSNSATFLYFQF